MKTLLSLFVIFIGLSANAQFALNLDGVDDSVDFAYHNDLGITNEITVECWVRQASVQVYPAFVSGYADSISGPDTFWHGWWLGGQDDGTVTFWMADPTVIEDGTYVPSTTNIADGTWHHVAGTFVDDTARLYVDGTLESEVEVLNWNFNVDGRVLGGIDYDAEWFQGGLEDVRIWDYARTEADIDLLKDQCLVGDEAGLVAYYHFEEGAGTVTEDLTPATNDADIYGSPFWSPGLFCTYCDFKESGSFFTETVCVEYTVPSGDETYTSSGTVLDTIPNSFGCDSLLTIDITIMEVDTSTTITPTSISSNESGASYQWIDCDTGLPIAGETDQDFTPTENGSYAVIVDNGCIDTSACVSITTAGIEAVDSKGLRVFPNPTSGSIRLVLNVDGVNTYLVTGMDGKQMLTLNPNQIEYDLSELSNGIYYLIGRSEQGEVLARTKIALLR